MKLNQTMILAALIFSFSIMPAMAHETHEKHDEMQEAKELEKSGNVPDILKEIKEHEGHLQMLVQNGQLDQVHEVAFTIRDLSKSLYEKSKGVSPSEPDKMKLLVDQISQIADSLDQYGDAGDKEKTQEQFEKLQKTLGAIEKQFPGGALNK